MEVSVPKIRTNDNLDVPYFEAEVLFWDDANEPHQSAEVTVFLDKNENLALAEVKDQAIRKARNFLAQL